ncbi:hypothetical protein FALBO_14955 [Fusarium albosuccineum]|uniref:NACHT domain-containing protein n=1 Tax=Fusarium albosuccineum TaxID=1237068 RepID=A0A8H4PF73_9HYPO|nr:hypothetical protein FALBO_14955 [Fusarium albosuccineum]
MPSQEDFDRESKQRTLGELLKTTDQARQSMVDKSWSFKRKTGEVVFVRDVLAKAVKWINHFKDVGDVIVQYDPTHAALPWAGVRFLLNVAVGDFNTYTSLLEGTTNIAEAICRNALVESLLKNPRSSAAEASAAEELSHALVKWSVFEHGVLASTDLESAFAAIDGVQKDVDRCAAIFGLREQLESHAELKRMLKDFDAPVHRWGKALHAVTDQLHGERRIRIVRWISSEPHGQYHIQANSEVLEGTGEWLVHDPTFIRWKNESASSILWLYGIPGSGKSKLTSIVVEDAQHAFRQNQAPAPVYFYCSRNPAEPGRSDPPSILASIARQLSTPQPRGPLLKAAIDVYKRREEEAFASGPLRLDESRKLILNLLEQHKDASMTIVIDALDECNSATRGDLMDTLEELLKASPCLLKIFVSSRTDQDIVYKLKNYPNMHLSSDRNSADIDLFVQSETQRLIDKGSLLRFSTRKAEIRDKIIHELTSKAQGIMRFRWVSLQLQALCQLTTDDAIGERLGRLPKTLADLYREILERIEELGADTDRQFAQSALSWLLCAREQLRSDVFLTAVSTTKKQTAHAISKDQLLQLCCNLIVFDSTVDVFRFSHLSVREFLEDQELYKQASANALVAEACLLNLMRMTPEASLYTPLLDYSCLSWAEHASAATEETHTGLNEILPKFLRVEQDHTYFDGWHRRVEKVLAPRGILRRYGSRMEAALSYKPQVLLVICAYDLCGALGPEQWRQLAQKQPRNKQGAAHQEVAARYGGGNILRWQLSNEISFDVTKEVVRAAAENEKSGKEVLRLLLDERGDEIEITEGVVKAAAGNSGSGKEVLELLLDERGVEIKITEGVVKAAAGNSGSGKEILELLLDERGAEIKITEGVIEAVVRNFGPAKSWESLEKSAIAIKTSKEVSEPLMAIKNTHGWRQLACCIALILLGLIFSILCYYSGAFGKCLAKSADKPWRAVMEGCTANKEEMKMGNNGRRDKDTVSDWPITCQRV